ncbi:hypothetical protein [uncultured Bifidobacterium sp.]
MTDDLASQRRAGLGVREHTAHAAHESLPVKWQRRVICNNVNVHFGDLF